MVCRLVVTRISITYSAASFHWLCCLGRALVSGRQYYACAYVWEENKNVILLRPVGTMLHLD